MQVKTLVPLALIVAVIVLGCLHLFCKQSYRGLVAAHAQKGPSVHRARGNQGKEIRQTIVRNYSMAILLFLELVLPS